LVSVGVEDWTDFNVAIVGASAALAGLVIVAASVNIAQIVQAGLSLTARLLAAVLTFALALSVAALGLVPNVELAWYGAVVLAAALVTAFFEVRAGQLIYSNHHPENRFKFLRAMTGFLPVAAYLIGAGLLLIGTTSGLYFFAAGAILAVVSGLVVSWIALVEVLR
jgi:hypothetical protein